MLDEIDLIVFDKDGTLIDFHAMWGGWARELGTRLEASARRPVAPDVFAAIGFDPTTGRVAAGGPLATSTMGAIEDTVGLLWTDRVAAKRVEAAIYSWERLTGLLHKTAARLHKKGIKTTRPVPPKVALPLIL